MTLVMLLLFLALFVGLLALGTSWLQKGEGRVMRERLVALAQAAQRAPSEGLTLLRDDMLSAIPAFHRLLARSVRITRLQTFLLQADIQMRPGKFLLMTASLAAVTGLVPLLLRLGWWLPLLGAAFGLAIPFLYVAQRRKSRFFKFGSKFPEAIDLLVRAVRAGHSLTSALELIAQELSEPLAGEFRKVFEEQKFGMPVRDALLNLGERVPLLDVKFFVTAVLLQRESGGNLAEILDKLSYLIRERFKLLRQLRVYTAHARMTMLILMCLPVGWMVLVSVANPEYLLPLYTYPLGHKLIAVAIGLQLTGYLLIRKIAHIRV
jgi:tight adherence protein B